MVRLAIDKDGAKLSVDQFRNKYGRDFVKRKKATMMSDFFVSVPKKPKTTRTANAIIKASPITLDETHAIIELDEIHAIVEVNETPNAPNVSNMPAVRPNVCGGAFSTSDRVDVTIQNGLEITQHFYHCATASGVIKIIKGTAGVYSMFHLGCDGINVQ